MKEHWRLAHLHLPVYMSGVRKDVIQDHIESVRETAIGSNDLRLEVGHTGQPRVVNASQRLHYTSSTIDQPNKMDIDMRHVDCEYRLRY